MNTSKEIKISLDIQIMEISTSERPWAIQESKILSSEISLDPHLKFHFLHMRTTTPRRKKEQLGV